MATAASGVTTLAIKWSIGRNRPYAGNDSDEYRPFRGTRTSRTSFPSGHASVSFAMASVITEEYNAWWQQGLAYGTAAAVSVSRIYQDRHWASDILGGAAIGIGCGKWSHRRAAGRPGVKILADGRSIYAVFPF